VRRYWLAIEFTIGQSFSIDKRLPIFSGKISHSFACVFDPDLKSLKKSFTDVYQ
jgi:hypothetical protein